MALNEHDTIRLLEPCRQPEFFGDAVAHEWPAGTVGTIVDTLSSGRAFLVEFSLRDPQFDEAGNLLDSGQPYFVALPPDQIESIPQ